MAGGRKGIQQVDVRGDGAALIGREGCRRIAQNHNADRAIVDKRADRVSIRRRWGRELETAITADLYRAGNGCSALAC
jgi:hypothetical protein